MRMRGPRYFYFALARELKMTVSDLLARLDSRELTEWRAYFSVTEARDEPKEATVEDRIKEGLIKMKG